MKAGHFSFPVDLIILDDPHRQNDGPNSNFAAIYTPEIYSIFRNYVALLKCDFKMAVLLNLKEEEEYPEQGLG
jgi:hypothetical protein